MWLRTVLESKRISSQQLRVEETGSGRPEKTFLGNLNFLYCGKIHIT